MNERIWAYLIHLGHNMWGDPGSTWGGAGIIPYDGMPNYCDKLMTERPVWDKVTSFLPECGLNMLVIDLGEGVQYESHPELAIPGSWSKDELRAELARLRGMGITPIPKLNFSACHDAWLGEYRLMRCTKKYYEVCRELIDEVCELFDNPPYFHLGLDEENAPNQVYMSLMSVRQGDLWWHDAYYLFDCCAHNNVRPWVWSDYYWDFPEVFVKRMPKSVLQSNWRYDIISPKGKDGKYKPAYQAYLDFNELGYDQVPTASTWAFNGNIEQTVRLTIEEKFDDAHLKGFMAAPWLPTTDDQLYGLMNDAHRLGNARRLFEREFGK